MKLSIARPVIKCHKDLDEELWQIAVVSKEADPDIKLMGLFVRVRLSSSSKEDYFSGISYPYEESNYNGRRILHPAGRINMTLGTKVSEEDKAILFAHELRHIGQFHRGRKIRGYLDADFMGDDYKIEGDCYKFEQEVISRLYINRLEYTKKFNSFTRNNS